jgi:polyisoprenoid-binding protein YceI
MRRLALIAAMLMATPAVAAQWNVDPLTSKLLFTAEQAGEKFSGSFPAFTSVIAFDEAAPEKGSIRITIDMSKLQVEGKDRPTLQH